MAAHHGTIDVANRAEGGAEFTIAMARASIQTELSLLGRQLCLESVTPTQLPDSRVEFTDLAAQLPRELDRPSEFIAVLERLLEDRRFGHAHTCRARKPRTRSASERHLRGRPPLPRLSSERLQRNATQRAPAGNSE